jgi:hypothetical protein
MIYPKVEIIIEISKILAKKLIIINIIELTNKLKY